METDVTQKRKAYKTPKLIEWGDLQSLTLGSSGVNPGSNPTKDPNMGLVMPDGNILMPDGTVVKQAP